MHQMIRRLDDDAVIDAVYRIEPEIRLKQSGAVKLCEQTRRNLLLGYSHLERLGAIDVNLECGIVERLGDSDVDEAREAAHLVLQSSGDGIVGGQVVAGDLHVDGGRQTEIQHLADDVGGLKVAFDLRKVDRQHLPNPIFIHRGRAMPGLELDQNVSVLPCDAIGLVVGKVVRSRDAYVVAVAFELGRRNYLADRLLDSPDD